MLHKIVLKLIIVFELFNRNIKKLTNKQYIKYTYLSRIKSKKKCYTQSTVMFNNLIGFYNKNI